MAPTGSDFLIASMASPEILETYPLTNWTAKNGLSSSEDAHFPGFFSGGPLQSGFAEGASECNTNHKGTRPTFGSIRFRMLL